ncbi:MAG: hypothetical protein F6K09_18175 [Merismopedia sp. SIO2A8]|nr:hypothetical protein [Merismopedia sp. SIO2A8]
MTAASLMRWHGGQKQLLSRWRNKEERTLSVTKETELPMMGRSLSMTKWGTARWGMAIASAGMIVTLTPGDGVALARTVIEISPIYLAQGISERISDPPGLCYMSERDLSGRWITQGEDGVVPLVTVCQAAFTIQESQTQENGDVIILSPEETTFWQAFTAAASPDAWEFAASLDADAVMVYGETICLSLEQGEPIAEIRAIQSEGNLPPSFDAAVNVAAIHAYCPQFTSVIGRSAS